MKTSIHAWSVKGDTGFAEMFAQIAAAGFDGIELNIDAPGTAHGLSPLTSDSDLAEIKKLSEEEIFDLARSIIKEKNTIFQKLSTMTNEEREQNTNLVTDYEFLQFKLTSLQDALWLKKGHKKGHINIDIPIKKKQKTKNKKTSDKK